MWFKKNEMQDFNSFSLQNDALGSHFPAFSCNKKEGRKKRVREGNKAPLIWLQKLEAYKKNPHQIV